MSKTLHLLIPGLLGPWPQHPDYPRIPALARLLSRAVVEPFAQPGFEPTLFGLFGYPLDRPDYQDLPVAAASYAADHKGAGDSPGEAPEPYWWIRTDPVHLRADMHRLRLFDARMLAITEDEARVLVAQINHELADDGRWLMLAPVADRWYLRLNEAPAISTRFLTDAIGRDIQTLMPQGPQTKNWHALLTEIQMVLHDTGINEQRESAGRPAINSVWLWGGGRLDVPLYSPAAGVYADESLARGLARHAGVAVSFLPDMADDWYESSASEASSLLVIDGLRYGVIDQDFQRWEGQLKQLDDNWFKACERWLKKKYIEQLYLYPGNGRRYVLTPAAARRFWQITRPLAHYTG